MASDCIVTAHHVLTAVLDVQRRGTGPVIEELEKLEPDLMEYVMESTSRWYHTLLQLGLPARRANRLYRQGETVTLVCLLALRKAHFELWLQLNISDPTTGHPPTSGDSDSAT